MNPTVDTKTESPTEDWLELITEIRTSLHRNLLLPSFYSANDAPRVPSDSCCDIAFVIYKVVAGARLAWARAKEKRSKDGGNACAALVAVASASTIASWYAVFALIA